MLKPVLSRNFRSCRKSTKNLRFWRKWVKMSNFVFGITKRHILAWNDVFWCIDRENRHNGLRVTICQNPKTSRVNRGRSKFVNRIVIKFCIAVGIRDVITHANFGGHRFTRFWVAGVEFHIFLLTLDVYLITLWHNRASVWYPTCIGVALWTTIFRLFTRKCHAW